MDKSSPLYDTTLSDQERAEYLVSQMTLEEKFTCFSLRIRIPRLGIFASTCGALNVRFCFGKTFGVQMAADF